MSGKVLEALRVKAMRVVQEMETGQRACYTCEGRKAAETNLGLLSIEKARTIYLIKLKSERRKSGVGNYTSNKNYFIKIIKL